MSIRSLGVGVAFCAWTAAAGAADQIWKDDGADGIWSTHALNWDAGAAWVNGNSAVFSGAGGTLAGETVEISNAVIVADITFQTNGYVIADADANGTLTLSGGPSHIAVSNVSDTASISAVIGGNGFTKTGLGLLQLKGTNTYTGVTTVSAGTLKLDFNMPDALGTAGAGNHTVVADGATLDFNGCYVQVAGKTFLSRDEDLIVSGSGVEGVGSLINSGSAIVNAGFRHLTLAGDAAIGGPNRLDLSGYGSYYGNGYTLTKTGNCEVAVTRAINNSPIIIAAGTYIVQTANAFGGTDYATTLNGGNINFYVKDMNIAEHFYLNGGRFRRTGQVGTNTLNGTLTFGNRVTVEVVENVTNALILTGLLDGTGGFTENGPGSLYVTGPSNTYSGATVINGPLYLGRPNLYAGSLGSGAVTNYGTVYCYSGRLGSGNFVNNNLLYFDATNTFAISNNLLGSGMAYVRYGGQMTMSGNVSSNGAFRLACGGLLLTNGVRFNVSSDFTIADRLSANYPVDPTNVTATLNVADGTLLSASAMVIGNGNPVTGGGMTGTVNQIGGTVRTFGWNGDPVNFPGEREGLRIAHYGLAYGTYNMMGGTLIVDNGYRLSVATDGRGWFRQTGGQVYADDVMVNSRDGGGGYGRLTVEGGVLNVGSNGIAAGVGAPYLVEYGGSGGVIRAVTNFASSLNAVLYGTGTNAGTFDTKQWAINLSGKMTGQGGLNKTGTGTLTLTGTNAYGGGTSILEGTLSVTNRFSVPNGALRFGVTDSGACGVLSASGDFDLGGLVAGVVNPEALNKHTHYRVVSCTGVLSGTLDKTGLPGSWIVYYDRAMGIAELRSLGSVFWLR